MTSSCHPIRPRRVCIIRDHNSFPIKQSNKTGAIFSICIHIFSSRTLQTSTHTHKACSQAADKYSSCVPFLFIRIDIIIYSCFVRVFNLCYFLTSSYHTFRFVSLCRFSIVQLIYFNFSLIHAACVPLVGCTCIHGFYRSPGIRLNFPE